MTLLSPINQWEFSVSGETGNSLFSKDVYNSSIFLSPHPLPSQVFRFALASSSLAILSASTIRLKNEKIEDCEQSTTDRDPVLYDIFYLVQYLLDRKAEFIPPVNCRSLIKQNGNYQQAYFRRSQDAQNQIKTHVI